MTSEPKTYVMNCSFCGKSQHDVKKLIAGPGVYICDACVGLCATIVADSPAIAEGSAPVDPLNLFRGLETTALATSIAGGERVRGEISAQQQLIVDVLRERKMSWADIGAALGVTRQAVWRRFGATDADLG